VALRRNLSTNPSLKTTTAGNATAWTSTPAGYARQTGVTGMDRTTGFGGSGAIDVVTTPGSPPWPGSSTWPRSRSRPAAPTPSSC
jgi:hypothetical protein